MNGEFAGKGEKSSGAVLVTGFGLLEGTHEGAVWVEPGGHLRIDGVLFGALRIRAGAKCTIIGTVNGAVTAEPGSDVLTNPKSVINGANGGTLGFGELNGVTFEQ